MRDSVRVLGKAAENFWDELFLLMGMNVVTVLLAVPVLTLPPALAGLWNVANRVARGRAVHWRDYWEGMRRYAGPAWGLALLNLLVILVLLTNLRFYTPGLVPFDLHPALSLGIRGVVISLLALWSLVQLYPLALLLEQEDRRLRVALRNAAVLFVTNPLFTAALGLLLLGVAVVSTALVLPWVLVTPAFVGVVCNGVVLHLLEPYRESGTERE